MSKLEESKVERGGMGHKATIRLWGANQYAGLSPDKAGRSVLLAIDRWVNAAGMHQRELPVIMRLPRC